MYDNDVVPVILTLFLKLYLELSPFFESLPLHPSLLSGANKVLDWKEAEIHQQRSPSVHIPE